MKEIQIKKISHEINRLKGVSTDVNKGNNHTEKHFYSNAAKQGLTRSSITYSHSPGGNYIDIKGEY